jgi:hypothetical protein
MDIIYKLTSPKDKVYIGRTNDFQTRLTQHKHNAMVSRKSNSLYRAIRKYGWDNFKKEILCEVDADISQKIEEELIIAYNSVKTGYNDTYAGGGGNLWKDRKDTNEYMEFVEKMKKINQSNRMHGKSHSDNTKELQKEKAKGRYSLDWFIDRNGDTEGTRLYEERCHWLKNRNLKKDSNGRFISSS